MAVVDSLAQTIGTRYGSDTRAYASSPTARRIEGSRCRRRARGGRATPRCMFAPTKLRRLVMYVRVVRFTDVNAERMDALLARIHESDGPPPGVRATGITILSDDTQRSAVVLQYFATA